MDTVRLDFFRASSKYAHYSAQGFLDLGVCIAPSSWTLPSHASLLTGMYPSEHGSHETESVKNLDIDYLRLRVPTLASELREKGYTGYLFSANPYVTPVLLGPREFDHFYDLTDEFKNLTAHSNIHLGWKARRLIELELGPEYIEQGPMLYRFRRLAKACGMRRLPLFVKILAGAAESSASAYADKVRIRLQSGLMTDKGGKSCFKLVSKTAFNQPFFALVNLMEAHEPYFLNDGYHAAYNFKDYPETYPPKELLEKWKKVYAQAVDKSAGYASAIAGSIVERYPNTVVVVTSDHGQEFLEHGYLDHGTLLHDELVKVPFLVYLPVGHRLNASVKGVVSLVNFKRFAESASQGNPDVSLLYSEQVCSESFGTHMGMPRTPFNLAKYRMLNKPRKRCFKTGDGELLDDSHGDKTP